MQMINYLKKNWYILIFLFILEINFSCGNINKKSDSTNSNNKKNQEEIEIKINEKKEEIKNLIGDKECEETNQCLSIKAWCGEYLIYSSFTSDPGIVDQKVNEIRTLYSELFKIDGIEPDSYCGMPALPPKELICKDNKCSVSKLKVNTNKS